MFAYETIIHRCSSKVDVRASFRHFRIIEKQHCLPGYIRSSFNYENQN